MNNFIKTDFYSTDQLKFDCKREEKIDVIMYVKEREGFMHDVIFLFDRQVSFDLHSCSIKFTP